MYFPYHMAPGLGDLLPGSFVVPQNPIRDPGTVLVPSVQAMTPNRTTRRPTMGELVRASFVVPQNPLAPAGPWSQAGGMGRVGCGGSCGCGGGCGGGPNFYGMSGMGQTFSDVMTDITSGNFSQAGTDFGSWISEDTIISSIPNWGVLAAGAVALMLFLPSGKEYRTKSKALRSQYRGYRRAAQAIS